MKELSESGLFDKEEQTKLMELSNEVAGIGKAASGFQKILSSMSSEDAYRLPLGPESNIEFVMKLQENWLDNPPFTFPSPESDYITVGTITSKVSERESEELVSWFDLTEESTNNRNKRRVKAKQQKAEFAEMASEQLGREVNPSEFDITYPDVQLHPLAIYALN